MINVKPVPAIALLIIFSLLIWVAFGGGCKDEAEAKAKSVGITFTDCNFVTTEPNEPESIFKFVPYTTTPSTTLEWTEPYESEPNETIEIKIEIDCSHRRLESIDNYWAITSTMQTKGTLIHGEYRCLDCGWDITIVSAVSTKGKK